MLPKSKSPNPEISAKTDESLTTGSVSPGSLVRRNDTAQLVEFQIADQRYAFPIEQLREILILANITPLPQVPDYVAGVSNLRGDIIPIIHLRVLMGLPMRTFDEETRTIVVNMGEKVVGYVVDSVAQVLRAEKAAIASPPASVVAGGTRYVLGLLKTNNRLVIILDVDSLIDLQTMEQATSY